MKNGPSATRSCGKRCVQEDHRALRWLQGLSICGRCLRRARHDGRRIRNSWCKTHKSKIQPSTFRKGRIRWYGMSSETLMVLLAGATTARVTASGVDLIEPGSTVTCKCSVDPSHRLFGCTDVSPMTVAGLPWTTRAISTQTGSMTTGTTHFTASTSNPWTRGQLSGQLSAHCLGGGQQLVAITGHGRVGGGKCGRFSTAARPTAVDRAAELNGSG